jgi:integrase
MGRIDAPTMQAYYDSIIEDGRSTGTAKNKFVVIASIFKRAHDLGTIRLNPCAPVEILEVVQEERKPFTAEQEQAIFEHLALTDKTDWKTACMLSRWAALRLSDAANLTWSSITQKGEHTILSYLPKKKTSKAGKGKLVVIPALGPLPAYLKALAPKEGPLCPSLYGIKVGGKNGLSAQFAGILAGTGMDRQRIERGEGRRAFNSLSFHSLRHGFVSWLTDHGVDLTTRKMLSDHDSDSSHAVYTHPDAVKLADRLSKLGL